MRGALAAAMAATLASCACEEDTGVVAEVLRRHDCEARVVLTDGRRVNVGGCLVAEGDCVCTCEGYVDWRTCDGSEAVGCRW